MDWRNEKNRIIQTFWSSHGSALLSSYGWPHAEYNLMSWALSCLSLFGRFLPHEQRLYLHNYDPAIDGEEKEKLQGNIGSEKYKDSKILCTISLVSTKKWTS